MQFDYQSCMKIRFQLSRTVSLLGLFAGVAMNMYVSYRPFRESPPIYLPTQVQYISSVVVITPFHLQHIPNRLRSLELRNKTSKHYCESGFSNFSFSSILVEVHTIIQQGREPLLGSEMPPKKPKSLQAL